MNFDKFRPLLSPRENPQSFPKFFEGMKFPLLGSAKIDGIRCCTLPEPGFKAAAKSRTNKLLPNLEILDLIDSIGIVGLDGELVSGNASDFGVYNRTQSTVMSINKSAEAVMFHVFDFFGGSHGHLPYIQRLEKADELVQSHSRLVQVPHKLLSNLEELLSFELEILEAGYEGIMLRDPFGKYKNGRATYREGIIYKLKRFEQEEMLIVGVKERMHNTNVQETDERGYAKRSSAQDGLVPTGVVGKFLVTWRDMVLEVGTGNFCMEELEDLFKHPEKCIGKLLTVRYFSHGVKDKPRQPIAIGFRDKIDL